MLTPPVKKPKVPMTEKKVVIKKVMKKLTELPNEGPPPLCLSSILLFIKYQQRLN
jgi:hypothetical protein